MHPDDEGTAGTREVTLLEAAAELGLTPHTLRQQIHNGVLIGRKIGRDWVVRMSEVERYRAEHKR